MSRAEDIFQKLIYFGEDALDDYIINRQAEELFLDFKQATPGIGKNVTSLPRDDRKNLAKCISGFGNSEGGVIIWGVECSRDIEIGDVAKAKIKVKNVHRFLSWLENAISGCTIPSHNKVRNHIISIDENGDGYIATYIPKAEVSPLMSTVGNSIYIRSGSSEKKIEVLENINENQIYLPEKEKEKNKKPEKYVRISFAFHVSNSSSVIARELYLSCTTEHAGGEYNKVRFSNYAQVDEIHGMSNQLNLVTRPELRLPPRGTFKFANVEIILTPYITDDFLFDGIIGAAEAAPRDFRIYVNKNTLRAYVAKILRGEDDETLWQNEFFNDFFRGDF